MIYGWAPFLRKHGWKSMEIALENKVTGRVYTSYLVVKLEILH